MVCFECGKSLGFFKKKNICRRCKNTFCSKHVVPAPDLLYFGYEKDDKVCQGCEIKINFDVKPKYKEALEIQDKVLTFTQNYKGKVHIKENSAGKEIVTVYFKDKKDADKSLRTMAAFQDYNLVYDIKYEYETRGSTPVTKYFRAKGIPALQKQIHKNN